MSKQPITDAQSYANFFAQLFASNVDGLAGLTRQNGKMRQRTGRDPGFREVDLAQRISRATVSLANERFQIELYDPGIGRIDYATSRKETSQLSSTIEVKGPLRRKFLKTLDNHYPDILLDIRKQVSRARRHPEAHHFLGLLFPETIGTVRSCLDYIFMRPAESETETHLTLLQAREVHLEAGFPLTIGIILVQEQLFAPVRHNRQ